MEQAQVAGKLDDARARTVSRDVRNRCCLPQTIPFCLGGSAKAVVRERFGIRHETFNDEPMGQADVSDMEFRMALRSTARPRNFNDLANRHPLLRPL